MSGDQAGRIVQAPAPANDGYAPPADVETLGLSGGGVRVVAASLRGPSHRVSGAPRQDAMAVRLLEDRGMIVAVVCDGAGTAPRAEIGARLLAEALAERLSDPDLPPAAAAARHAPSGAAILSTAAAMLLERCTPRADSEAQTPRVEIGRVFWRDVVPDTDPTTFAPPAAMAQAEGEPALTPVPVRSSSDDARPDSVAAADGARREAETAASTEIDRHAPADPAPEDDPDDGGPIASRSAVPADPASASTVADGGRAPDALAALSAALRADPWRDAVHAAVEQAWGRMFDDAGVDPAQRLKPAYRPILRAYHATVVAVVASREGATLVHIGDGVAAAVHEDEGKAAWAAPRGFSAPANGEYVNQTFFATSPDWWRHLRIIHVPGPLRAAVAMSDGPDPFAAAAGERGLDPGFWRGVDAYLRRTPPQEGAKALAATLDTEQARAISDDDKTLVWIGFED